MKKSQQTAVVTGAGRGIGKAVAGALAARGMNLVIAGRTEAALREIERELAGTGAKLHVVRADLSTVEGTEHLFREAVGAFGGIDILVNNAGLCTRTPLLQVDEAEWQAVMDINAKGLFFLSQKCFGHMEQRGGGYIINISSTVAHGVPSYHAAYGASKHAVRGISEMLAANGAGKGIKVSTIYPDMTDTEMLRSVAEEIRQELWMEPSDIAQCVLFLLDTSERMWVKEITPYSFRNTGS